MDQPQLAPEVSYFSISKSLQQVSSDDSTSRFRIPRRPVVPQTHKHAPQASISSVPDASETNLLGPESSGVFEMRSIEPLNSNIFTPQSSSYRSFKSGSYNLGPRHRKVHWKTPVLAIVLFMVGVALAIGHHIYLSSLDGNPDTNQSWTGRFSLAFAFLTKASFSAAVALAMKQVLWYTFRRTRKGISISAIDSFFEIQPNPFKFLHFDIWYPGLLVTIFAMFLWLLPLVPLVSPTSLSTALTSIMTTNSGCIVPNLNFLLLETSQSGVSLADAHGTDGVKLASPMAQKLASLTAYNGEILSWPSPCGSNCSYGLRFDGPAWQCTNSAIDNSSAIAPFGGTVSDVWGTSIGGRHDPSYQAAFSNETGLFWVGRSTQGDIDSKTHLATLNISVFYCENWNAAFDIRISYTSSIQTIALQNITYLNNFSIPYVLETATSNGESSIEVPFGYQDPLRYTHAALFRSLGELMSGLIMREPFGVPVLSTSLASIPGLISFNEAPTSDGHYQPVANLRSAIEELSRNLTISLLSSPVLQIASTATTTCYNKTFKTVWVYDPWILWLPYGMAILVSVGCLLVGGLAVFGNEGQIYDNSFSTVLRTTRNRELDELVKFDLNGGQPLSQDIGKTRVRLGNLRGDESAALEGQEDAMNAFVIVQ